MRILDLEIVVHYSSPEVHSLKSTHKLYLKGLNSVHKRKQSVKSDYLVTTYLQSFIDPIESHLNPELTEEVSALISYRKNLT